MSAQGITFTTHPTRDGSTTAICLIAVTPDGQRSMSTYLGACRELTPDDVNEEDVAAARILYIEGYLWDEEQAKQASRKAIAAAKGAGGRVALSLSDSFCVGRFRNEFLHLMDRDVNILFANEEEAKALFEVEDFDGVVAGAKKWGGIAALTRSAKGCVIVEEGMVHQIPAAPVKHVVDTTGAGDQFAAGFLYGLTRGKGLAECGQLGALAAAEVISHYGARPETSLMDMAAEAGLV
jgi:sugar/nucleoside kinase (ribokinase family)